MAGPWEKYQTQPQAGPWAKYQDKQEAKGIVETAARFGAQGASGGLADEIYGTLRGIVDDFTTGASNQKAEAKRDEFGRITNLDEINKGSTYEQHRDSWREGDRLAKEANPKTAFIAEMAGGVASPVNKVVKGMSAAKGGATLGALYGAGNSEADSFGGVATDTAIGTILGGAGGKAAEKVAPYIEKGINRGSQSISNAKNRVGQYFKKGAEDLAENATGATASQAEKFQTGAGRELLDRGLVKFGDTAEKVAERVGRAQDEAGDAIGRALKDLDSQGVTASVDNVVKKLESEIGELSKSSGNEKLIRQIQSEIDNLYARGESKTLISLAEESKRNFQGRTNYKNPDMLDQQASGKVADAFRQEVEDAAVAANQNLGNLFKESKDTYSLLKPIREASERRATQLKQSPIGGLLDVTGAVAGGAVGGIPGAVAGSVARRTISPRVSSSAAVVMDGISKRLLANPQMAQMAKLNPQQFNATVIRMFEALDSNRTSQLPKAVDNDKPKKGPEKWVLDGIDKLNQAGVPSEVLEQFRASPYGREILIEASDASPGSVRMKAVLEKIRTAQGGQ